MNRVNRYLFSSFVGSFASLFATLYIIVSMAFFIQMATLTSYIEITFAELGKMYLYIVPRTLLFTVPISFFVAVAMSFFRLSKENESIVIFTLGQSPKAIGAFFLKVASLLSLLLLFDAIVVIPYAHTLNENFKDYKKTRISLNIKPGEFGQRFGDWKVFIGGTRDENGTTIYEELAMYNHEKESEKIVLAKNGEIVNTGENMELRLNEGVMYNIGEPNWNVAEFGHMVMRVFFEGKANENHSFIEYWKVAMSNDGRAEDLTIFALLALFPIASVLFGIAFGVVTYRYEKGIVYFGVFGVLSAYFSLIMAFARHPFIAVPIVFALAFALSVATFKRKVLRKY